MNGFKRFCLFIFSLAGLLSLAALALPWVGPWQKQAADLITSNWYYLVVLEVLVGITALGLLAELLRSLLARKNKKNIVVTTVDGGQISVSRDAIASQAAHIIEEDGTCTTVRVDVDARRRNNIKVRARVLPSTSVDVLAKGNELHARLASGLAAVCGDNISSISIEFEEPEEVTSAIATAGPEPAYDPVFETVQAARPAAEQLPAPDSTSEITLDMTTFHAPEGAPDTENHQEA